MAKVTFTKLGLKVNKDVNKFTFNDQEIEVLKYLPIEDKYDLIMIALQKAKEDQVYNELLLDQYFHLNIVYLYSNITFTDKQKEDENKLYDQLKSTGFLDSFLSTMDEAEYNELLENLVTVKEDILHYNSTAAAVLSRFIYDLPKEVDKAATMVDEFDPKKYEQVVNFAKAVGAPDNLLG